MRAEGGVEASLEGIDLRTLAAGDGGAVAISVARAGRWVVVRAAVDPTGRVPRSSLAGRGRLPRARRDVRDPHRGGEPAFPADA